MIEHPPWCSPQHCYLNEDGVRVHEQQPMRWEEHEVRFESRLLFPDGEHPPTTYLQLHINDLRLTWRGIDAFLLITATRRAPGHAHYGRQCHRRGALCVR